MTCLSLPKAAAAAEKYSHNNHDCDQIALYTLFKVSSGLKELQRALTNDSNVSKSYFLSEVDLIDSPLLDVLNHHLETAKRQNFHPTIFFVAHSKSYDEDGVPLIEVPRIMDHLYNNHDVTVFGAYGIIQGANMTKIRDSLEPGWLEKRAKTWLCESIGSYTTTDDPLKEVVKRHPWHCLRIPRMSRQWCICVDSTDPRRDSVLLLHIDWNGNTLRESKLLLEIGAQSGFRTERVGVEDALRTLAAKVDGTT